MNSQDSEEQLIESLLGQLTLDEKIAMVSGQDVWSTHPVPRLGIPSMKVTDGPHGVRSGKATCFPTGIGMAATWNPELIRRIGVALAEETRAKGCDILLGPCVNIARTPLNGRNFESFGEDPHLASRMAVAYVQGIQSRGIGSSTKHFACNNQEQDRFTVDVRVGERALREIYLPAFEAAVQEADTWTVMTAHNKINGAYGSANDYLVNKILKGEWGFRGFTVSDWGGVHDTVSAANGGQDLEMPGPGVQFDAQLKEAIAAGAVSEHTLDDKVRRILYVAAQLGAFDQRYKGQAGALDTPEHRKLAREAAGECLTLLKNQPAILPLDLTSIRSLALIGPHADAVSAGGGGSSLVDPTYFVTPLDGIRELCGERVRVEYSRGCGLPSSLAPLPASALFTSRDLKEPGLRGEYFANREMVGDPAFTRTDPSVDFDWTASPGGPLGTENYSIRWTGILVAPDDGDFELGTYSDDGSRLYVNGRLLVDNWGDHGPQGRTERLHLKKGERVELRAEYYQAGGGAKIRLGWSDEAGEIEKAAALAAQCDVAVVCVGLASDFEGEDKDRADMDLPGRQVQMIEAVAAANPRTILVFIGGSPVTMEPWLDRIPSVLCAWYPGQECGHAVADALFGNLNPSGKMPMTFPKRLEDNPSFGNYPGSVGIEEYAEGLLVGYRHYDTRQVEPQFPFGHGLSYTRFAYSNLSIDPQTLAVAFDVENTGERTGKETAQLYIRDLTSSVDRPAKELKAFQKVELAPGQRQTLRFQLDRKAFSFFDADAHRWTVEPGEFEILIGSSSRDLRLNGTLTLDPEAAACATIQATASSVQNGSDEFAAQNAVDGNPRTRWSSEAADAQWLLLDLGEPQVIVGLELSWETARAKAYDILVSTNGQDWLTVYRTENGEGTLDDLYFGKRQARYVKLLFHKRATSWGHSLWEVRLLGADQAIVATASSSAEGSEPENLVDGNAETMWRSGAPGDAWVELDLSHPRTLGGLVLDWGESYARAYRIEVSTDGKAWKVADEELQGRGGREERRFDEREVRFVRVACTNSSGEGYGLREAKLVNWETAALASSLEKVRGLAGAEGCGFKIHTGRDGSFAPEPWPFQVGFWVHDRTENRFYTPETMETEWTLDDGRLPVNRVSWKAPGWDVHTTVFSRWIGGENRLATFARTTIRNTSSEAKAIDGQIWIKPSPLERARGNNGCREIEYDGNGVVKVDGKIALFVQGSPGATAAEQSTSWAGVPSLSEGKKITGDHRGATASVALRYQIEPGKTAFCDVIVPSGEEVTDTAWAAALDYESNLEAVRKYWRERTPMVLDLPDREYADCFYSSLNYLLVLKTGDELRPGPYTYTGFFLHDAVEMVEAFDKAGVPGVSRAALNQFHYNFGNYLDELGGSLYALYVHYLLSGDKDFLREVYPRIEEGCRLLQTFRAKQLTPEFANTEFYGLLPPSASQDNFSKPAHLYLDNWWGLIGLRVGLLAADSLGKSDDAKWIRAEYDRFHQDVLASLDRVMKREQVAFMPGFADNWPPSDRLMDNEHRILGDTQMAWAHRPAVSPGLNLGMKIPMDLFRASYAQYWKQAGRFSGYDGGWFVEYEKAFWGYNVLLARPLVYLGLKDAALKSMEWSLKNQSCPGAWMEAMPSRINAQGLREIAPGIIGDVPHGWSAAHYVLLLRDMLLHEEDNRLVLLSCVPDRWFEPGKIINVEKAVTYFGKLDFKVEASGNGGLHIALRTQTPPPGGYLLTLPHPERVRSVQVEGKDTAIPGDGKLALPPTAHNIIVQYQPAS